LNGNIVIVRKMGKADIYYGMSYGLPDLNTRATEPRKERTSRQFPIQLSLPGKLLPLYSLSR
jgi:hypothetical protein